MPLEPSSYCFDDVRIEVDSARVFKGGTPVSLEPKAFALLSFLIRNEGRLVDKRELLDAVWGGTYVTDNAMTRVVAQLRKALGDHAKEAKYIETVPKRGYRFIAPVVVAPARVNGRDGSPASTGEPAPPATSGSPGARSVAMLVAGIGIGWLVFGVLGGLGQIPGAAEPAPSDGTKVARLTVSLGDNLINLDYRPVMDLSPDGERIVFVGRPSGDSLSRLMVRRFDSYAIRSLPGTESAKIPFVAPDGRWVGFLQGDRLRKVPFDGGPPVTIAEGISEWICCAHWGRNDQIVWSDDQSRLMAVPAGGGEPRLLAERNGEVGELMLGFPQWLPDGRGILFSARTGESPEDGQVDVLDLETGERKTVITTGYHGRYAPSGHLVFVWNGALLAAPFDLERKEVTGPSRMLLEDGVLADPGKGIAHHAISRDRLIYLPAAQTQHRLLTVDRSGRSRPVLTARTRGEFVYADPVFSPDGLRLAFRDLKTRDIWIHDPAADSLMQISLEPNAVALRWSPDGKRIAFAWNRTGTYNLYWKSVDRSGPPERLTRSDSRQFPKAFSPDGAVLAYEQERQPSEEENWALHRDIWLLDLDGSAGGGLRKTRPFVASAADEREPSFSPDGRFLAFQSNATGRNEIYVVASDDPERRWRVSPSGGREPLWARGGGEILYRQGGKIFSVSVSEGAVPRFAKPAELFETDFIRPGFRNYDVSADGEHFLMVRLEGLPQRNELRVLLDWPRELEKAP